MIDRTIAPKTSLPNKIDLLDIKKTILNNGLKLYSIDGCTEPVLNMIIQLKAGRYYQDKEMLAGFVMSLLKKGTKNMSANEIAETLDFHGATLTCQSGMFMSIISLSCLNSKLEKVLPILNDILLNSIFPEDELVLEKNKQIQTININSSKTNYLASIEFNKAIFGKNHPCGYSPTEKSILALTQNDLKTFYKEKAQLNSNSKIIVAGKIDKNTISLIEKYIGSIETKTALTEKETPFEPALSKSITIQKKDSVQASLRIGMPFLAAQHQDFDDFSILNMILGGYFGSRLMKNIREEKGYTYGIYSYVSSFEGGSYFVIATDVGVQYKEATLNEISKEIKRLKTELISEEELQMVRNYYKGSIIKSVDGALPYANVLNTKYSVGLDETSINQKLKAIDNISAKRLLNLAKKYLNFKEMYTVIAG